MTKKQKSLGFLKYAMSVVGCFLFICLIGFPSFAQSAAKVTVENAKIRKEPNTTCETLGSAKMDDKLTINYQTTGTDGKIWYQVFVDADTLGFIRSDLVQITDGTTPETKTYTAGNAGQTTQTPAAQSELIELNPVAGKVTGGQAIRVRSAADTTNNNNVLTSVANGLAVTIKAQTKGTDGKDWYQVTFSQNGKEITGFIRNDFVTAEGPLTPYTPEVVEPQPEVTPPPVIDEPILPEEDAEPARYMVSYEAEEDRYMLIDNEQGVKWKIADLVDAATINAQLYNEAMAKNSTQKITIVVLVIFLIGFAGATAYLLYVQKAASDESIFAAVERETAKKREEKRRSQKVMHTVSGTKAEEVKPQGARPQGAPQGARPQGARPQGAPQGARPQGAPQGARPQGAPQGAGPQGAPQGARPQGAPQGARPQGAPQGARPQGAPQAAKPQEPKKPAPQKENPAPKNFAQDDEFEFEFLNWDGDE